jgi:ABC-type uncharacterized transport system substrate-binding protein
LRVPYLAILITLLSSGTMPAVAHPHVFVDVSAYSKHLDFRRSILGVFATEGLDADGDGTLSAKELGPLAKVNIQSLEPFGFFTRAGVGQEQMSFGPVTEYSDTFEGGRLTLRFTVPLARSIALDNELSVGIYDPNYFVAFDFSKDIPATLKEGPPPGCEAIFQPPRDLDEKTSGLLAQIPADQRALPPDLAAIVRDLGSHITLSCR